MSSSPWFPIMLFLGSCCLFSISSEASHARNRLHLPSVAVVGTVYCDTCSKHGFSKANYIISGASVAVVCGHEKSKPTFRKEAKTDENGEFKVHLPNSISKHVKKIKNCSVKLLKSSEPNCAVSSSDSDSDSLHLKSSSKQGAHIFSAGFFSFKPLKRPSLCNQEPSNFKNSKTFFPPIIPPILPTPPPTFGGVPLPPNPLQPPSLIPPNPFPFPPIPVLTPSPPPPVFPFFPFPPLPKLPPVPGFPGIPPASSSQKTTP